jgi:VWFA-related protein
MKHFAFAVVVLGLASAASFGQASRVRVVPTPTPKAPTIQNDTAHPSTERRPPVLAAPNGSRPQPSATATPATGGVIGDSDEEIKVETNLVTMPVSVLDRDGRFISGLQQRDFKIFENGVEQKLDYFQSVEQPFTVVMLIDVSPSTQFRIEEIQNAAIAFLDQLRPADRVMVISFDERVHVLSPATNNRNMLRNAIRQTAFGDGTSLYDAVDYALNNALNSIQGRKAVVLFTDGVDTTSGRSSMDGTLRDTEESDALFYTIRYDTSRDMNGGWGGGGGRGGNRGSVGMADILGAIIFGGNIGGGGGGWGRPAGTSNQDYARGKTYLEGLAQNSGGREFEANSMYNIQAAFSGIAEELRRQYSVGYYPDKVGTVGERRQIKIRVMRPNVVVRAKNSYIVGQTNRTVAGR